MSKASIEILPVNSVVVTMGDGSVEVQINGIPIAILICGHQAVWMCQLLNRAREASTKHESMNILTTQLGYCDDRAEQILAALKGTQQPAQTVDPDAVPDDVMQEFLGGRPN